MGRAESHGTLESKDLKAKQKAFPGLISSLRGYGALESHLVQPLHAQMVHGPVNSAI